MPILLLLLLLLLLPLSGLLFEKALQLRPG